MDDRHMMRVQELKMIVDILLDNNSSQLQLLDGVKNLSTFFENHFSVAGKKYSDAQASERMDSDSSIYTDKYLGIVKYLRAVDEALHDLLRRFEGKKVHLLYTGCSLYGALIVPLLHRFDPNKLGVSFLDIQRTSLDFVGNIIDTLGLNTFVDAYIQEDAAVYKATRAFHLVVTESMKAPFDDEAQIATTLNLLPQLHEKGIFIPQRVLVGFEAAYYKKIMKERSVSKIKYLKYLCHVLDVDTKKKITKENIVVTKSYRVTSDIDAMMQLQLSSTIYLYRENVLRENECTLNFPKKMTLDQKISCGDQIYFDYRFGKKPGIVYAVNTPCAHENWHEYLPRRAYRQKSLSNVAPLL